MRRTEREIKDRSQLLSILERGNYCTLALSDGTYPYTVPLNYGYSAEDGAVTLYFHGAKAGKKLDLLRKDPHAAFTIVCQAEILEGNRLCDFSCLYESLCGAGILRELTGEEALEGLQRVVSHYAPADIPPIPAAAARSVCMLALEVRELSGKAHLR